MSYNKGSGKDTCQSFSLDISATLSKAIASIGHTIGLSWGDMLVAVLLNRMRLDAKYCRGITSSCLKLMLSRRVSCCMDEAEHVLATGIRGGLHAQRKLPER